MRVNFCILRDGVTSTTVSMDIYALSKPIRFLKSKMDDIDLDLTSFHYLAYSDTFDVSSTDRLEEITVTGNVTGSSYRIINKTLVTASHTELYLEPCQFKSA